MIMNLQLKQYNPQMDSNMTLDEYSIMLPLLIKNGRALFNVHEIWKRKCCSQPPDTTFNTTIT